jgi:MFS family permease
VKELARSGRPVAILGHSHGGNIVMESLARGTAAGRIAGVVSFGTPFFTRRLKTVPWLIALFQVLLGLVITPIMIGYIVAILGAETGLKVEGILLFGLLALAGLASLRAGIRKLLHRHLAERALQRTFDSARWLVLHSPRDEAMRFLEVAGALQPRYVTVSSADRSLTAFAALAGVAGTILLFGWNWFYFLEPIITKVGAGNYGFGTAVDFTFLLLFPVVFAAIYGLVRLIARLGGAWAYARVVNLLIHGGVVGAAYGGDSAFHLTRVTRVPPYVPGARETRIDALDLGGIDDSAVFVAAQQLYDSVLAKDMVEGGIGDPDVMWKRLSDALYHNAYMRDRGVIAGVAEHLIEGWQRRSA